MKLSETKLFFKKTEDVVLLKIEHIGEGLLFFYVPSSLL